MSRARQFIEVDNLHVTFPGRSGASARAVDGVNLNVREGEIVGMVGESGCGKTTLARTILGLEKPASGEVRFHGKPLTTEDARSRRTASNVQLVLQDPTGVAEPASLGVRGSCRGTATRTAWTTRWACR